MVELSSMVLQHCQGIGSIISETKRQKYNNNKNSTKRQRHKGQKDRKTKLQKDKKIEKSKLYDRPSSKSNQLQPTVLLAASPPSVLSLQVFQLFSHFFG